MNMHEQPEEKRFYERRCYMTWALIENCRQARGSLSSVFMIHATSI